MFIRAREDPALSINIQRIMVTDFFDDYMIIQNAGSKSTRYNDY